MSNRMKKQLLSAISAIGLIAITTWYFYSTNERYVESVHHHAGFKVYLDNELQDYSSYQYMNFTPCLEHEQKKSAQEEQVEKAHLHDSIGDVVHVHRPDSTWGDLFTNIGVEMPRDKKVTGYVEGIEQTNFLEMTIEPYTTLVVSIGETNSSRSGERIERAYIEEIEAKSELCGS